jgi:lipopolysaccharide transport periplasmic protein LptA
MNESFPRFDTGRSRTLSACRAGLAALIVALPLAGFAPLAHADRADKDKPLNVEADNMTYDDLKQVNIFTGHVVATKGTIVIKADRVEVTQDPQGYQYATGTSSGGNLSYFRQKREGLDEYIEGTAIRIDYDGKQDLTTYHQRHREAPARPFDGMDQVHGSVITYDGQSDFYTAKAARTSPARATRPAASRMLAPRNGGARR